jgi:hypothetical protein
MGIEIQKWLKAGVLEDGRLNSSTSLAKSASDLVRRSTL